MAGANQDGTGQAAGEINTLQIVGSGDDFVGARFETITNIDALSFVDTAPPVAPSVVAPHLQVEFLISQIGIGLVSLTLAVDGSFATSPHAENEIRIHSDFDPTATTAVNLDLSGWTFTNWNPFQAAVGIETNRAVALNDSIVGTSVDRFHQRL